MRFFAPIVIVLLAAVLTACGDPPATANPAADGDVTIAANTPRPTANREADPPGNPLGAARRTRPPPGPPPHVVPAVLRCGRKSHCPTAASAESSR